MKNWTEQCRTDVVSVFFDLEIFGEVHTIDGKDCCILLDNDMLKNYNARQSVHTDGLYAGAVLFYVAVEELGKLPVVGGVLQLDEEVYRVGTVIVYDGVAEIVLEVNRGW